MDLLDLMIKIGVDDQATAKIGGVASKVKSGLGGAAKVGAAAMSAVGVAAGAASAAFASNVKQVAEYGDSVDKMSQKMGMSAEAYQEWDAVMQHSGTSMATMKASMKTLANAAQTGSDAFDKLGISQKDIASMSQEELFEATITALQDVDDETERTYLAGKTLGRGATELGALLNTSAEDTQKMRDRVHELGGVMSDESVKASAAFQDSLQDMTTAIEGMKRGLIADFLPSITTVMDGLQEIFAGSPEEGLAKIEEGVQGFVLKVQESMPKVTETLGMLLPALVTGIAQMVPSLLEAAIGVVTSLASALPSILTQLIPALLGLAPQLLQASITLFLTLAQALAQDGPAIVNALLDTIMDLIDMVVDNSDAMLEAALTLFMAIATALLQKAPEILQRLTSALIKLVAKVVSFAPKLLTAAAKLIGQIPIAIGNAVGGILSAIAGALQEAVSAVAGFVGDMLTAGGNMAQGLIDGIIDGLANLGNALIEAVKGGLGGLLKFLGINSPSKLMRQYGVYTAQGFIDGVTSMADGMERAMSGLAADATAAFDMGGVSNVATASAEGGRSEELELLAVIAERCGMHWDDETDRTVTGRLAPRLDRRAARRGGLAAIGAV